MPIPLPDLDDRSYAELTAEALALLPGLCPAWTDYNPSDPGITLVELLAWLTEMLLFQVNQVPPASTGKFLKLLNPPGWAVPDPASLDAAVRTTIQGLREPYRAVTAADYEWLALNASPGAGEIARAHCVPRRDLSAASSDGRRAEAPAHMSLVILTPQAAAAAVTPLPAELQAGQQALCDGLSDFFDDRRTLTTRHHVVGPVFVPVVISANLALRDDAPPDQALQAAHQALAAFYDPLSGGEDKTGWPFGRAVYPSDAAAVLQRVALLDYVENVQVTAGASAAADHEQTDEGGQTVVMLDPGELVQLQASELTAYDSRGNRYPPAGAR